MKNNSFEKKFLPLLGAGALLSAAISLYIGLSQSVWFDEAYSILLAEHSWSEIIGLTIQDVHPPVYYWLLKAWMAVFGSSELALRSMSGLFFGLSVACAGLVIRKLFGAKTALLALPFVAFAPFLLRYGFEIRMYAFVSFIGVAATYVLVLAVDQKERQKRLMLFGIYSLLVAVGVYSLYFMALVWAAHLSWLAWLVLKNKKRELLLPSLIAYIVAFMMFLPWLVLYILENGKGTGTLSPVTTALGLEGLLGIVTFLFLYHPTWQLETGIVIAVLFTVVALLYLGFTAYKKSDADDRKSLAFLVAYFFVPVSILVIVTQFMPIYLERYLAHFAIGGYMTVGVLVALGMQRAGKGAQVAAVGMFVVFFVGCLNLAEAGNYNFQRVHTPSIKNAADLVSDCKNGTVLFADGPQVAIELSYYVKDCPIRFFNETLQMGGGFAMLSGSPLRVADAREEFQDVDTLLYIYYNKPTRSLPAHLTAVEVVGMEKLYVATYERIGVQ